ncbi:MAG: nitroreductase family protein [Marinifilaceae bacterium]
MKFNELIQKRYSVRSYSNKEVEEEKLIQVLEAGRLAPSAVNNQPWHFVVIRQKENRENFASIYHREWFREAPVYMVICGDHEKAWHRKADNKDHCDVDISIAVDHMTLQATELGLGTCWICNFDPNLCREYLKLPDHIEPIAILSLGYPATDSIPEKKRKSLNEIVHWEKF